MKYVETNEDRKFMDSIGRNLHKSKTTALKGKMKPRRQSTVSPVKGKSHYSGKTYNHG